MSVIGSNIIAGASGTVETGYQIARSLRFNSADSAYLNRTPASAGNRQKWTYSFWIKRSAVSGATARTVLSADTGVGTSNYSDFYFNDNSGSIFVCDFGPDASRATCNTTAVFRDPGAWIHGVIAVDTTQATAANRVKLYFNNVLYSLSTSPSQNYNTDVNNTIAHAIGRRGGTTPDQYLDAYMADIRLIDGQQLDPTNFGEFDANTGVWVPKAYTGTYGTNGFWLKFDDNSGTTSTTLGKDSSGNSNNWTPNNFSVTAGVGNDSLVDSPTWYGTDTGAGGEVRGNYATLSPLQYAAGTLSEGNLKFVATTTSWVNAASTIYVSSGKWYWEVTKTADTYVMAGVATNAASLTEAYGGTSTTTWTYSAQSGNKLGNGTDTAYGATWTVNDVIGVALDMDAGTLTFYKNGVSQGTAFSTGLSGKQVCAWMGAYAANAGGYINFGQRPFAYTAPSGFKALCTTNLPTPAIGASASTLASKNFNAVLWTGTGDNLNRSVTGVGFQPDFVWQKRRSGTANHQLYDVVRGAGSNKELASNTTDAEGPNSNLYGYLSSFDSDGFSTTKGSTNNDTWNVLNATFVAWNWKAGGTAVSNTAGSISSSVSANTAAGISVVTYTGTAAAATVGHGLGAVPKMIIVKRRNAATNWTVYNSVLGNTGYIYLNATNAAGTGWNGFWNSTTPTSTVFSLGNDTDGYVNASGASHVAYCFAEIEGFSKFGSYTGNGSADGPFIFTGFRPRWILIKRTDTTNDWYLHDTARSDYNAATKTLNPNLSNAEGTLYNYVDVLSNGFKCRTADGGSNASSGTYIYAAFAESPFNYSRAR